MTTNREQDRPIHAGSQMPDLHGEFLTGRQASLPHAAQGRVALVAFGFTYEARWAVEAWVKRFRDEYGGDPDFTFFEVPVISGWMRLGKWYIDNGMRKGTPRQQQENVISVYGGAEHWKRRLGYRDRAAAYLLLLDQQGRIIWKHAGQQIAEGAFDRLQRAAAAAVAQKQQQQQQQPQPAQR